jgi:hypothetical protein
MFCFFNTVVPILKQMQSMGLQYMYVASVNLLSLSEVNCLFLGLLNFIEVWDLAYIVLVDYYHLTLKFQ